MSPELIGVMLGLVGDALLTMTVLNTRQILKRVDDHSGRLRSLELASAKNDGIRIGQRAGDLPGNNPHRKHTEG